MEDQADARNYILKYDGTKIYTTESYFSAGIITKKTIKINDQEVNTADIKGMRRGNTYYERYKNSFVERIVHGKINVYSLSSTSYAHNAAVNRSPVSSTYTDYYYQKGDESKLVSMEDLKDVQEAVKDCPAALELVSISTNEMWKNIRKDRSYVNKAFETYNKDCKPVR